jgi:hypothetical protein
MATKTASCPEPLDVKEIAGLVGESASLFAAASASFVDAGAIFEAIVAATSAGSLAHRLANAGISMCEEHDSDFTECQNRYEAHSERFLEEINVWAEVRNG